MSLVSKYFHELTDRFGRGWNKFWFTPSDPFSLAVLRLFVGLAALYWYLTYWPDLERFFGPDGILPVELVQAWRGGRGFSYFDFLNTAASLKVGYFAGLVVLVMFTAGLFTRVTSVLAAIVVLSLLQRGPMLANDFDEILALLMVYLCIGPCGSYLSLDRWRAARKAAAGQISAESAEPRLSVSATISRRLIQVHLTAAYFMMAVAKLKGVLWWSGTAVWWISASPENRLVDLSWLKGHIYLINAWTHAIVIFELAFALLIWNRLARPALLAIAVPMWLGTAVVTDLWAFSLLMLIANLAFASPAFLRSLAGNCCRANAARLDSAAPQPALSGKS